MIRNLFFSVAACALLAGPVPAGEIKIHEWPVQFIPQDITTVPVVMDVGFFLAIRDQDKLRIQLEQKSIREYEGCTDMAIESNFNMTLSCSIAATGVIDGKFSCSVSPADLDAPGGTVVVCAKLTEANLLGVPGGSVDVHVATVTVKVVPR